MQNPDNGGENADSGEGARTQAGEDSATAVQRVLPQPHGGVLKPFPKGVSGNPSGRPAAGLTMIEWMNTMQMLTADDLRRVSDDGKAPALKRAAARSMLRTMEEGFHNATPLAANDLDRVLDRTAGKPTQRVEHSKTEPDPTQVLSGIAALLARRPDLAQRVAGVLPGHVVADVVPDGAETQVLPTDTTE